MDRVDDLEPVQGAQASVNTHPAALADVSGSKKKKKRVWDERDVEGEGHGGAQEDDVAPEDQKGRVDGVSIYHLRGRRVLSRDDPTGKQATANSEQEGGQQQEQDNLQVRGGKNNNLSDTLSGQRAPRCRSSAALRQLTAITTRLKTFSIRVLFAFSLPQLRRILVSVPGPEKKQARRLKSKVRQKVGSPARRPAGWGIRASCHGVSAAIPPSKKLNPPPFSGCVTPLPGGQWADGVCKDQ